jgi:hypothetical protein
MADLNVLDLGSFYRVSYPSIKFHSYQGLVWLV